MMSEEQKEKWIKDTALFYFRIFSATYEEEFHKTLLNGGGGNSSLCAAWYKLSAVFVKKRVSGKALEILIDKEVKYRQDGNVVFLLKKEIDTDRHDLFYSNKKGAENRIADGKYLHFDHHPSNKMILQLMNFKIKHYVSNGIDQETATINLSEFLKTIQTEDLITVEQDDVRTSADRGELQNRDDREALLDDDWYELKIVKKFKN